MIDKNKFSKEIISILSEATAIAIGDPITKTIAVGSLVTKAIVKGMDWFRTQNADWWNTYLTNIDAVLLIDEQINSPDYVPIYQDRY